MTKLAFLAGVIALVSLPAVAQQAPSSDFKDPNCPTLAEVQALLSSQGGSMLACSPAFSR